MKKIILIIFVIAAYFSTVNGQVRLGVTAGISSASYNTSDLARGTTYVVEKSKSADFGYHFGLMGQAKLLSLVFQPELLLSSIGNQYKISDLENATAYIKSERTYNLEFPLILAYAIGPLKIEAGPVGRILMFHKNGFSELANVKNKMNTATWAFQAGVGFQLFKITADLRYEFALSQLGDNVTIDGINYNMDTKVRQFVFGIGVFF
jgi:hypothetical protein